MIPTNPWSGYESLIGRGSGFEQAKYISIKVLARVKETVGRIVGEVPETGETLTDEDLLVQCKIYLALKKLVEDEGLDAIGNKCQPELSSSVCGLGWAACLSHSLLNDDGIMCACEADMPSCVTMFILNRLTGQTVFFGDLNSVVREKGAIRLMNCGSGPLSMAKDRDSIALWPVPVMMGYPGTSRGATTSFPLKPGPVTIAKLGGGKGTARIHMATGTVLDMPVEPKGLFPERWPQAVIGLDGDIDSFLEKAIGQHYLLVYGNWKPELVELCDILGIEADI
ncbi:MAG TPA: hypothetical protein GXX51_07170 [Firmicutes bacterium]|nr:hypothetical protein [Bacillota bacterium]